MNMIEIILYIYNFYSDFFLPNIHIYYAIKSSSKWNHIDFPSFISHFSDLINNHEIWFSMRLQNTFVKSKTLLVM